MNAMVHHPVFARLYPRMARALERAGMAELRGALLTGEVVEIGAGSGANFAHHPAAVTRVLAVEPEPHLRKVAQEADPAWSVCSGSWTPVSGHVLGVAIR